MIAAISQADYEQYVHVLFGINLSANKGQEDVVRSLAADSLFIVAGPGTGKTTALALRILKLIYVDNLGPREILATTFTRKAARELRSQILGRADKLRQAILGNPRHRSSHAKLRQMDFNQITTGTLDSIAQEVLEHHHAPNVQPPVVIEGFVADGLMLTEGLFPGGLHRNADLRTYTSQLKGSSYNLNTASVVRLVRQVGDRFIHDRANLTAYRASRAHPGIPRLCTALDNYYAFLLSNLVQDFSKLEELFHQRLVNGALATLQAAIRVVVVDEYQDTNALQEQIYFELASNAIRTGGSLTVVGDDDQSLFRFRGATVEVFTSYQADFAARFGRPVRLIYLSQNYRSTGSVIQTINDFVQLDATYQAVRVPGKPQVQVSRHYTVNYPVLGLFRSDVQTLAGDLADFIHRLISRRRVTVGTGTNSFELELDKKQGGAGDVVVLCNTPAEFSSSGRPRLPLFLRTELLAKTPAIRVFNPRGQELGLIAGVQRLGGLVLECIDPAATVQSAIPNLPPDVRTTLNNWRAVARAYVSSQPAGQPTWSPRSLSLAQFVSAWQNRRPLVRKRWDRSVPIASLVYKLVSWIPEFQTDVEGLVYLEAILRTITEAAQFSNFGSEIVFSPANLTGPSIRESLWRVFVPLASEAIEINEDLLETLPRDRVNIMSVHQSKGLEFPVTIVDVGSDYRTNHPAQAFRRFPNSPGETTLIEDEVRRFSALGVSNRSGLDRAFDDLIRLYFVAFSRAQDVLMLVGLDASRRGAVGNVAIGWDRNSNWRWRGLPHIVQV